MVWIAIYLYNSALVLSMSSGSQSIGADPLRKLVFDFVISTYECDARALDPNEASLTPIVSPISIELASPAISWASVMIPKFRWSTGSNSNSSSVRAVILGSSIVLEMEKCNFGVGAGSLEIILLFQRLINAVHFSK